MGLFGKSPPSAAHILRCGRCGQPFTHEAALREHERTSFCAVKASFKQATAGPYAGVDLVKESWKNLTATELQKQLNAAAQAVNGAVFFDEAKFLDVVKGARAGSAVLPAYQPSARDLAAEEARRMRQALHDDVMSRVEHILRNRDAHIELLTAKVAGLEKQLARYSMEPRIERAIHEKTDYTKVFSDEEDGLEADYRGWPKPKTKVVF